MDVRVGTSGWSYPEWKGSIYSGTPQRRWLERYAEVFDTVEVNLTYRRDLTPTMVERWTGATPTGFRFAIKAHQRATHFNRLKAAAADAATQAEQASALGGRLGVVYFQLPHNFARNDGLLESFLAHWPAALPSAWEFLHPSWHVADVHDLLRRHLAAWVISDAATRHPDFVMTGPFAYVRLRADRYDTTLLRHRADAVLALDVPLSWVFVRHGADAPALAGELRDMVR